jgi:serine/threonine protein kinase
MEWIEGVPLTEWVVLKSKDELNQMALQYLTVKIEFLRNCQFKPFQNMHYVDLKPEHIFVDSSGRLRFIDFGLCTIGDNSPWIGYGESPFTAPFAFISKKYSLQSDLYAISSIALFILNGGTILDAMNRNNSWTFGVPYWMIDLLLKMRECNDNYQYQDFQSLDLDWTKKRVA